MRLALIALLLAVGLGVFAYVDNTDKGPEQALLWAVFVAGYGVLAAVLDPDHSGLCTCSTRNTLSSFWPALDPQEGRHLRPKCY